MRLVWPRVMGLISDLQPPQAGSITTAPAGLKTPKDVRIQALAKDTVLAIFDEIKTAPNRDEIMRHAKRSQSKGER